MVDEEIVLKEFGRIVQKYWNDLLLHYPHVETDISIVMSNHIHGIRAVGASLVLVQGDNKDRPYRKRIR